MGGVDQVSPQRIRTRTLRAVDFQIQALQLKPIETPKKALNQTDKGRTIEDMHRDASSYVPSERLDQLRSTIDRDMEKGQQSMTKMVDSAELTTQILDVVLRKPYVAFELAPDIVCKMVVEQIEDFLAP